MSLSVRPVVFVPSTNPNRARSFYETVLGLEMIRADAFAVVMRAGGTTIRITAVGREFHVQPFTILGWEVEDIHAEMAELAGRGVEFLRVDGLDQSADGIWTAPDGTEVAWFKDPDGNTLSLDQRSRELLTEAQE